MHEALFRDGLVTTGVLLKKPGPRLGAVYVYTLGYATVAYRFEVDGEVILGQTSVHIGAAWWFVPAAERMRRQALKALDAGDRVLVLYDPADPSNNCCVPQLIDGSAQLDTTLLAGEPPGQG